MGGGGGGGKGVKRKEGALSLTRDPTDLLLCKLQALLPIP